MYTEILFRISILIKGIDALLEMVGGILLLLPVTVDNTIAYLSQHELYAEPRHPMTAHLEHAAIGALEKATLAGALYLIFHGLVKVILIVAVMKGKRWGYQGLIGVLGFFAVLELGRAIFAHSGLALSLAIFDAFIVYVISKEYKTRYLPGQTAPEPRPSKEPATE